MDSVPHKDFISLFERMNVYIDLNGCKTPKDIEKRMLRAVDLMSRGIKHAKKDSTKRKWAIRCKLLWIAMEKHKLAKSTRDKKKKLGLKPRRVSFASRVIAESISHPKGIINYALRYGYDEGKKKKLDDARRRMCVLTVHKRGIHPRNNNRSNI